MDTRPTLQPERYAFLSVRRQLDLLLLDEEVSEIGTLVGDAAEWGAVAHAIKEELKNAKEVAYAMAAAKLRDTPTGTGKARSEAQIVTEIPLDPNYQAALKAYTEASLDEGLWGALFSGLDAKSRALKVTSDLISQGFLTQNFIVEKRRKEIREVTPRARVEVGVAS